MNCPTCGEPLAPADERCPACGSSVLPEADSPPTVHRCPRCQYAGEGIGHFRRPGHIALLIVVGLLTWGLGGLVYWLVRRHHAVCPNCGLSWGYVLKPVPGAKEARRSSPSLPSAGTGRRLLGAAMALGAIVVLAMGVFELDPLLITVGGVTGLGGMASFGWGWRALQGRRRALRHSLERRVLRLATHRDGTLTVTDVASNLDLSLAAAERLLIGMDDGFRVRSDITDEGVLLFEFPEVRPRRLPR